MRDCWSLTTDADGAHAVGFPPAKVIRKATTKMLSTMVLWIESLILTLSILLNIVDKWLKLGLRSLFTYKSVKFSLA